MILGLHNCQDHTIMHMHASGPACHTIYGPDGLYSGPPIWIHDSGGRWHELNDFLLRAGGHIGYGIRPSARGRGLATWALQSVLVRASALGLRKALVTCGDSNLASARVIEKAGGVLEDVRETELGLIRRYWITL